jgi:chemotaxis signal transduction protein
MNRKAAIDWQQVRLRLEHGEAAIEKSLAVDAERMQAAFRQRAARLAQPLEIDRAGQGLSVLVFGLGSERYAVELPRLLEVISRPRYAAVPGAGPELAGVLSVRGEIHPIWDLARLLGLPDLPAESAEHVLLVRRKPRPFGLRTGPVEGVRELQPAECGPARPGARHVKWVTPDLLSILDIETLLKEDAS